MHVVPVTLIHEFARLEPMTIEHLDELTEIGLDKEIWRWSPESVDSREDMANYIGAALEQHERGKSLPFVTREPVNSRIVGSTRFGNIDPENRKVEIGWTWLAPEFQRTGVNTAAKLLMLTHAFETWGCVRVELKTDALNERSRAAILRIGAVEEGTLRSHMITETGRRRDTVYFSILDAEWPSVKTSLQNRLKR